MLDQLKCIASRLAREEEGATLVEYVLMVALVGIAAVVGMCCFSGKAQPQINTTGNQLR